MSGKFAADHASALADIKANGAYAPISVTTPGEYDAATDTTSDPTTVVTPGYALGKRGDPDRYRALELIEASSPTLLWCPATYGDRPPKGGSIPWGGRPYTVRDVSPLQPDGVLITADIVVAI